MKNKKEIFFYTVIGILLFCFNVPDLYSVKSNEKSLPVIQVASVSPSVLPPGQVFKLTFNWEAVAMDKDYSVWVNITNNAGVTVFRDDYALPSPTKTSTWAGKISYTRLVRVPDTLVDGTYKIIAGLYDRASKSRQELMAGKGVVAGPGFSYQIGTFTLDAKAPPSPLDSSKPPTLNLKGYKITFQDEFDGPLDVSAWGPGTKWIAHTPYSGDFGDAKFTDPENGFPFSIADGILRIEAKKEGEKWKSGLLCSVDTKGEGFSQQYGYFEMRAKFPKGPGTWPAFWLLALQKLVNRTKMGFEVDIIEQYGREPNIMHSVLHWWPPERNQHKSISNKFVLEDMYKDFHNYGFLWDEKEMIWYFDSVELWRQPTPPESKTSMYVLVNLALGPGWPIDKTPNPSLMLVDYVRVFAKDTVNPEHGH